MRDWTSLIVAGILGFLLGGAVFANVIPSPRDPVCIKFDSATAACIKETTRQDLIDEARERESAK